jgi:hypothetical protein
MKIPRWTLRAAAIMAVICGGAAPLAAQGVTTGAISGTVTNEQGKAMEGAQVQVTNRSTGARAGAMTRTDGRYSVQNLDVGGPYTVTVRHIGYAPVDSNNITVSLGQNVVVDLTLRTQAAQLTAVTITAAAENSVISPSHKGISETITDSSIARLPSANRNFTDFLTVVPQIATKGAGGNSGGGQNNRFNAIQVDGSIATDLFGLGSTGQPGGQANAKQIPLDAVKEYQVLLAPFDVRQGEFTGFLLNAVTKSGTNDVHGEVFGAFHNQDTERDVPYLRNAPFSQDQYGGSVGGPIVKDELHYFVSAEFEHKDTPAGGPYFGQPTSATVPVPVSQTDWNSFASVLQNQYHYANLGSIGQLTNGNPLANVFVRLDESNLPFNSRLVARYNYASGNIDDFPVSSSACNRSASAYCASNSGYNFNDATNNGTLQLFTNFNNGNTNEILGSFTSISDIREVGINAPFVQVKAFANPAGGTSTTLSAGTDNSSQGNALNQDIYELTDNYTIPVGTHRFTLGAKGQLYHVRNLFSQNSLGFYTFGNLDSLIADKPDRVQIGEKLDSTDGAARFHAHSYAAYVEDEWQVTDNFDVQYGLRLDVTGFDSHPGTNANILNLLKINTADVPTNTPQYSPRVGFNWDVTGDQKNQLRGGTGLFVGEPVYVWLSDAFGNSGVNGYATFTCTSPSTAPAMPTSPSAAVPTSCSNGSASAPVTVNTVDPNLKLPQAWRSSLGYDRRLPWGVVGSLEGMYTKMVEQFFYTNLGLQNQPVGYDSHGRALYGNLSGTSGQFTTLTPTYKAGLSDVINIGNETSNKDYSYNVTAQLQKRFSDSFEGSIAYTRSRSYDQYDLTSSVAYSNWQFGRDYAGPQGAQTLAPSKWDIPNRVVASGTYSFKTKTDVSFIFTAESGAPYTWVYSGDANGDGSGNNDPMFIPTNAHDPTQIQFIQNGAYTPSAQADSMNAFISRNSCLASQEGTIMKRDSCRLPFTQELDMSFRQSLKSLHAQNFIFEVDVFNFLNLLNKNWGLQSINGGGIFGSTNDPFILTRKTFTGGNDLSRGAQPVFAYSPNFNLTTTQNVASNYRIQALVKYTF